MAEGYVLVAYFPKMKRRLIKSQACLTIRVSKRLAVYPCFLTPKTFEPFFLMKCVMKMKQLKGTNQLRAIKICCTPSCRVEVKLWEYNGNISIFLNNSLHESLTLKIAIILITFFAFKNFFHYMADFPKKLSHNS
jgi:hypothetical protein